MINQDQPIEQQQMLPAAQNKAADLDHFSNVEGRKQPEQASLKQQAILIDKDAFKPQSNIDQAIKVEDDNINKSEEVKNPIQQAFSHNELREHITLKEQKPEEQAIKNHQVQQNCLIIVNEEKIFEMKQSESRFEAPSVMESNKTIQSKFLSQNINKLDIPLAQVNHKAVQKELIVNGNKDNTNLIHQRVQAINIHDQVSQKQGYRLKSQLVESIQQQKQKKVVEFVQFPQSQKIQQSKNIEQIFDNQKKRQFQQKLDIKAHDFSFSQRKQQQSAQNNTIIFDKNPSQKKQESLKQGIGMIAKKIVHQKKIHDVIVNLQRNDPKKIVIPKLQQTKKLNKQPDLSRLSANITFNSNIISLTIGELVSKQDNQAVRLLEEIEFLKRKLQSIEGSIQRHDQLNQEQNAYKQAKFESIQEQTLANKHNKRQNLGQIYRRIEHNNSKLSQQLQNSGIVNRKGLRLNQSQTVRSAPKPRFSSFSNTVQSNNEHYQLNQVENRAEKSLFRVRKNKISLPGQTPLKQAGFIRHQKKSLEKDKCFQTRKESLQRLQFSQDERLNLIQRPQPRELTFDEDFDQYVSKYFFDIGNEVPKKDWNQQELVQIAKITYKKFGVNLENQKQILHVKKYKNCVSFILDSLRTIIWYYEGKFYYGGWDIKDSGEGEKNGWGYQYSPKKFQYTGHFKANKRDGYGIMKFLTQQADIIYQGYWKNGLKTGQGKQKQVDKSIYIGEWLDGKKNGKGKLLVSQQQRYEGQFLNGIKNGEGRETFASKDTYEGNYKQGKFHGYGIYTWANFSRYEGQFRDGRRNGQGVWIADYRQKNSDNYQGQYKDDKKSGFGLYCWKDGAKYEGQFLNDLKHGEGLVSHPDGKSVILQWYQGNIVAKQASIEHQQTHAKHNESDIKDQKTKKSAPNSQLLKFNIKNVSRQKVISQK